MNEHETKFLKKMLRTRKAEALEWLRAETPDSMRVLGEYLDNEAALGLVQRMYDAGAVKVLVIDIKDWAGGESSNDLLVELPSEARPRRRLLEIQAELVVPEGFEGDVDEGQQYVFVGVKGAGAPWRAR
jgi:hypothetical protein